MYSSPLSTTDASSTSGSMTALNRCGLFSQLLTVSTSVCATLAVADCSTVPAMSGSSASPESLYRMALPSGSGKKTLPSCGVSRLIAVGLNVTVYVALLPAGTTRNSAPVQKSLWITGLSCQSTEDVFWTVMSCAVDSRTLVLKLTTLCSASCTTQLPVRVRYWSVPPSIAQRMRSARMSGATNSGWKAISSLTSWLGWMKPSVG
mmetsp:Transcript_23592/g.80433  ORF Transcript_23592/g.80433 Transcript_23592/m.80433 type:complete len:205 (+) Transcript_23592:1150-1764(+)